MNRTGVFKGAKAVGVILGVVAMIYAGLSVYRLFTETVGAPAWEAALSAVTLTGTMAFLLIVVWATDNMNVKGLAGLLLLAFAGIAAVLVGLEATIRGGILTVPREIGEVGRVAAALLPALVLIPTLTLLPASRANVNAHPSGASSFGHYAGVAMKGAAILASSVAAAYFGISRGMPPFVAVFAGVLLEGAFIWCILSAIGAKQRGDKFDRRVWLTLATLFGLFIAAVAVQSFSSITGIDVPIVAALGDVGASLYVSAVGLCIGLTILAQILTHNIDQMTGDVIDADVTISKPTRPALASRAAAQVRAQREAWGDLRQALTGDHATIKQPAQLATTAKDAKTNVELRDDLNGQTDADDAGNGAPARPKSESAPEHTGKSTGRTK